MYSSADAKYSAQPNQQPISGAALVTAPDRAQLSAELIVSFERMRELTAKVHVPEFLTLDVTMQQAKALRLIQRTPGIGMSALAAGLGVGLSTVSGNVDRLAEMDLVVRHDDPVDRRQVAVTLTDRGKEVMDRFQDLGARMMHDLLESLTIDEMVGLRLGLGGLVRVLEQRPTSVPTDCDEQPAAGHH
jgi:DNA-binding MarR family transcriptional regulator